VIAARHILSCCFPFLCLLRTDDVGVDDEISIGHTELAHHSGDH